MELNDSLEQKVDDKNLKVNELGQLVKKALSKQNEIYKNMEEKTLQCNQLTQSLNDHQIMLANLK